MELARLSSVLLAPVWPPAPRPAASAAGRGQGERSLHEQLKAELATVSNLQLLERDCGHLSV